MRNCLVVIAVLFFAACGSETTVQDGSAETSVSKPAMSTGKQIFINNCIQCHNIKTDKIGPKLEGVFARWNSDTVRIRNFIRNSQESVHVGDPRAVEVYKQWNEVMMTPMPHLSDNDINELLDYINKGEE